MLERSKVFTCLYMGKRRGLNLTRKTNTTDLFYPHTHTPTSRRSPFLSLLILLSFLLLSSTPSFFSSPSAFLSTLLPPPTHHLSSNSQENHVILFKVTALPSSFAEHAIGWTRDRRQKREAAVTLEFSSTVLKCDIRKAFQIPKIIILYCWCFFLSFLSFLIFFCLFCFAFCFVFVIVGLFGKYY